MRRLPALSLLLSAATLLSGCTQILPEESVAEPTDETSAPVPTGETNGEAGTPSAALTPDATPTPPADPVPPPAEPTPVTPPPPPAPATPPPSAAPTPSPSTPPSSATPAPAPPAAEWPREGSYVKYAVGTRYGSPDGSYRQDEDAVASWTFTDGDWAGTCTKEVSEFVSHRGWENSTATETYAASDPPHWPLLNTRTPPPAGEEVRTWLLEGCAIESIDFMHYAGTDTETATRQGRSVLAATHLAEDADDGSPSDFRSEWSRGTGLVLYWEWQRSYSNLSGRLVDTDAPLG